MEQMKSEGYSRPEKHYERIQHIKIYTIFIKQRLQILLKFSQTISQETLKNIQERKTRCRDFHDLKVLESYSHYSYHCGIILKIKNQKIFENNPYFQVQ